VGLFVLIAAWREAGRDPSSPLSITPFQATPKPSMFFVTDMLSNSFASQHSALHFTSTVTYPSLTEELGGGDSPPS